MCIRLKASQKLLFCFMTRIHHGRLHCAYIYTCSRPLPRSGNYDQHPALIHTTPLFILYRNHGPARSGRSFSALRCAVYVSMFGWLCLQQHDARIHPTDIKSWGRFRRIQEEYSNADGLILLLRTPCMVDTVVKSPAPLPPGNCHLADADSASLLTAP